MRRSPEFTEIYLQPGEYFFGQRNTRIRTLLGSCVAITLWHPVRLIGGMCHYLLPSRGHGRNRSRLDGRYGEEALNFLLKETIRHETELREYQIKLFGGGHMFPDPDSPPSLDIGARNIAKAQTMLKQLGCSVQAEHVGGYGHRSLIFDVWSGDVWVKFQVVEARRRRGSLVKHAS